MRLADQSRLPVSGECIEECSEKLDDLAATAWVRLLLDAGTRVGEELVVVKRGGHTGDEATIADAEAKNRARHRAVG